MEFLDVIVYVLIFLGLFMALFYLITFFEMRKKKEPKISYNHPISIIIPTLNMQDYIGKAIKSVFSSDYDGKMRVIIVDDGSTDQTISILNRLKRKYSTKKRNFVIVKGKGNTLQDYIKARAINIGIEHANTELTATLDADTLLQKDLLKKMVNHFADPRVMAVTCRIMPVSKKNFFERMQAVEYAITSFFRLMLSNINALPIAPAFTIYKTKWLRKEKFDEGNLTEDFEMALRIHSKYHNLHYILGSYVSTYVPRRFKKLSRQRERWGYGTLYNIQKYRYLFKKRYGDLGLFLLPSTLIGILILLLILLLTLFNLGISIERHISLFLVGWRPFLTLPSLYNLSLVFTDPRMILGLIGLAISLFIFYTMKRRTKAKIYLWEYFVYIFIYIWLLAYFYVVAIFRFISKKPGW